MLLREQLEGALLRDVAELPQAAERLLARRGLLLAHNLAPLVLDQILARQATLRVVGRAVENLRLAADRGHLSANHGFVLCGVHLFLPEEQIFFNGGQRPALCFVLCRRHRVFKPVLDLRQDRAWI